MFFFFAVGSMMGYALQNVLLARHARNIDGLSLAFYRNISLIVTMIPLLFGSTTEEIGVVLTHWVLLVLAGIAGSIYLALSYLAMRSLPVGITSSLSRAVMTVVVVIAGWTFLHETLSIITIALIAMIIIGSLILGREKNSHIHLTGNAAAGVMLTIIAALFLSASYIAPITLSRIANPLVSGYAWEVSIGISAALLLLIRWLVLRQPIQRICGKTFLVIAGCSSPTLAGTGLYTLATHSGSAAIATAIGSASIVVTSLMCWWLYSERLNRTQWIAICIILIGVIGLKIL